MIRAQIVLFLIAVAFFLPARARAVSLGDAALTVAVTTAAGGVLGASTLPFYSDSGKHTKNIFYGAAFGAVIGVFLAAYAGVEEGADEEEGRIFRKPEPTLAAHWPLESKLAAEPTAASIGLPHKEGAWVASSISIVSF